MFTYPPTIHMPSKGCLFCVPRAAVNAGVYSWLMHRIRLLCSVMSGLTCKVCILQSVYPQLVRTISLALVCSQAHQKKYSQLFQAKGMDTNASAVSFYSLLNKCAGHSTVLAIP